MDLSVMKPDALMHGRTILKNVNGVGQNSNLRTKTRTFVRIVVQSLIIHK
jgi:hypothetical protein